MLVENLPKINFRDRDLLFIDLEMTGLDVEKHEIVEIAALLVDSKTFEIKGEYHSKAKPVHFETADPDINKILDYTEENWKDAKAIQLVLKELAEFAPNAHLVGYNSAADFMFLDKAFLREGTYLNQFFDYHLLDVYSLAYIYFNDQKSPERLRLRMVAEELGVKVPEGKHNALDDVKTTYKVFLKLTTLLNLR
jgi:DNA polymerase III epsilon subunit-like protein